MIKANDENWSVCMIYVHLGSGPLMAQETDPSEGVISGLVIFTPKGVAPSMTS